MEIMLFENPRLYFFFILPKKWLCTCCLLNSPWGQYLGSGTHCASRQAGSRGRRLRELTLGKHATRVCAAGTEVRPAVLAAHSDLLTGEVRPMDTTANQLATIRM